MMPPPGGPPEELGVLLPLQLETKFRQDDPDRPWRMLLRVIPQPPAIDSHSDHLTPDEIEAVRLFRDALNSDEALQPDWFGTPDHRRAFAELAERVGPARATWLAQHAPRSPGEQINPADEPAMVRGLPARLRVAVWTHANGAEQLQSIGDLPNDPDNPDATIAPELPLPRLDAVDSVLGHWVADWPEAVRSGSVVVELPDGLGPADLGVYVWGIGDEAPRRCSSTRSDGRGRRRRSASPPTASVARPPPPRWPTRRAGRRPMVHPMRRHGGRRCCGASTRPTPSPPWTG